MAKSLYLSYDSTTANLLTELVLAESGFQFATGDGLMWSTFETVDALGRELSVPAWGETALAAAFWAALSAGCAGDMEEIRAWVRHGANCRPEPRNTGVYERVYPLNRKLYQAAVGSFDDVARLQPELSVSG